LGLAYAETRDAVKAMIDVVESASKPLLLDADGLKAFAEFKRKIKCANSFDPSRWRIRHTSRKSLPKI
jgi:NAD(P)H-hydrate repair Nnr-like enzyme with NAD(P)H-hydrate dehydratase domain